MKSQFLKMAGVKSDAAFYQKFPTEESFFQAYPDAEQMVNGGELEMFNEYDEYDDVPIAQAGLSMPSSAPSFNPMNFNFDPKFANMANAVKPMNLQNAGATGFGQGAGAINSAGGVGAVKAVGGLTDMLGKAAPYIGPAMDIIDGISAIKEQNNAVAEANQSSQITGLSKQAAQLRPEEQRRQYVRPEDFMVEPNQLFPTYGVGTNVLNAEDGAMISSMDYEYEPIEYAENGISSMLNSGGFGDMMTGGGGNLLNNLTNSIGSGGQGPTAGNRIGKGVGAGIGTLVGGPVGGMIGGALGSAVGGLVDSSGRKIKAFNEQSDRNLDDMIGIQFGKGVQSQFSNVLENGGSMPSYGLGGDLKVYDENSEAESMSYNPYLPEGGETVMFRGPSHEDGGIPIKFGNSPVEVEGGEPAVKLENGGGSENNMVVFGNLKIPKEYFSELGKASEGKKFKNYIADLSKIEAGQNKLVERNSSELELLDPQDSMDKLKLASFDANFKGANMKLKVIADKKNYAARIQNAINETAEEYGLVADDLARGKFKEAEYGAEVSMAQTGKTVFKTAKEAEAAGYKLDPKNGKYYKKTATKSTTEAKKETATSLKKFPDQLTDKATGLSRTITSQQFEDYKKANTWFNWNRFDPKNPTHVEEYQNAFNDKSKSIGSDALMKVDGIVGEQFISGKLNLNKKEDVLENTMDEEATVVPEEVIIDKPKFPFMQAINSVIPFLRPTDGERLNDNQLLGEMYALSNNQVDPVYAQKYNPQLLTPFDMSLQDQLNEVTSQSNSAMRMAQGDASVLSGISAQSDIARSKILGDQFRMNQANKMGVYNQNINSINDANLKNIGILDQQSDRQARARSATKATTQEALNSISSKVGQNRLENRSLATYENMYNYRFDNQFRARNMNPLADLESMYKNAQTRNSSVEQIPAGYEMEQVLKKKKTTKENSRNGSIVRALKTI